MTDEKRALLKLLSLCLAYPDAETLPKWKPRRQGWVSLARGNACPIS